jgi:hypothetical protein
MDREHRYQKEDQNVHASRRFPLLSLLISHAEEAALSGLCYFSSRCGVILLIFTVELFHRDLYA